jgi:predicted O-methyltransferase YrrM
LPGKEAAARELGRLLAKVPSRPFRLELVKSILDDDPNAIVEAVGPALNRSPTLTAMPLDLEPEGRLEFEDLAGLFASTSLNHGVVGMTIRQVAYIFGLARRSGARKAIEIGRWRGGSAVALAAAIGPEGTVWSIDSGEKETRVLPAAHRAFDEATLAFCDRFGLDVRLIVGDSHEIELDIGEVDIVLIDGDHSYEGTRADFERFGRRVRAGGHVLFDDAFDGVLAPGHSDTVGRVVAELEATDEFRLCARIDRLAHFERVAP